MENLMKPNLQQQMEEVIDNDQEGILKQVNDIVDDEGNKTKKKINHAIKKLTLTRDRQIKDHLKLLKKQKD